MLPFTAGARPGKMNMMSLPNSANSRLLPERKPSPTPTSSSKDPTPQAIPNMVRKERSLCTQRLRKICAKISRTIRIIERHCTFRGAFPAQGDHELSSTNGDWVVRSGFAYHWINPCSEVTTCNQYLPIAHNRSPE